MNRKPKYFEFCILDKEKYEALLRFEFFNSHNSSASKYSQTDEYYVFNFYFKKEG